MKKGNKGFTLIELLVVIAIIAILSTVVMAGLNSARQKGRDAKRVADVNTMQQALELFFDSCAAYPGAPAAATSLDLSTAANRAAFIALADGCPAGTTMATFLASAPTPVAPPAGNTYTYASPAGAATYTIAFTLEGQTGALAAGAHTATPAGIQ